jgi:hypothetical protein
VISPPIGNDQPISAYSSHSMEMEIEENNNGIVERRKLGSIEDIEEERFKLMAPNTWRNFLLIFIFFQIFDINKMKLFFIYFNKFQNNLNKITFKINFLNI